MDRIGRIFAVFNKSTVLLYCYQCILVSFLGKVYARQKQPGCKKVQDQSEATMVIRNKNSDIK